MEDIGLVILIALYILLGWKKPAVALITSPFVAGMVLILGITTQNVVIITSSPILFFLTLLAVSLSKKDFMLLKLVTLAPLTHRQRVY